jgi:hypothetical protein
MRVEELTMGAREKDTFYLLDTVVIPGTMKMDGWRALAILKTPSLPRLVTSVPPDVSTERHAVNQVVTE